MFNAKGTTKMYSNSIYYFCVRAIMYLLSYLHTAWIKRKKGVIIGNGTRIFYKSAILNWSQNGRVLVGDNSMIGRYKLGYHAGMPFYTTLLTDGENSKIIIGDNCRINGAYIHAKKSISIGDNCVIASGVNIIDSNGHEVKSNNRTVGRDEPSEIVIGNNVWIGLNAIILKDTQIGDNSIVAAGTVVKGYYGANSIISSQTSSKDLIL